MTAERTPLIGCCHDAIATISTLEQPLTSGLVTDAMFVKVLVSALICVYMCSGTLVSRTPSAITHHSFCSITSNPDAPLTVRGENASIRVYGVESDRAAHLFITNGWVGVWRRIGKTIQRVYPPPGTPMLWMSPNERIDYDLEDGDVLLAMVPSSATDPAAVPSAEILDSFVTRRSGLPNRGGYCVTKALVSKVSDEALSGLKRKLEIEDVFEKRMRPDLPDFIVAQ